MISVLVNIPNTQITEKVKEEKDLCWYDPEDKKMLHFKGGKLSFDYKYDEKKKKYKVVPKVEDIEINKIVIKRDKDIILKWFDKQYLSTSISVQTENNENVIFEVPEDELDDFLHILDRNRFEYSVEK